MILVLYIREQVDWPNARCYEHMNYLISKYAPFPKAESALPNEWRDLLRSGSALQVAQKET